MTICTPLLIYIILTVVIILFILLQKGQPNKVKLNQAATQGLWSVLIGLLMYWACESGYEWASWVILLAPIIGLFIGMFAAAGCAAVQKK